MMRATGAPAAAVPRELKRRVDRIAYDIGQEVAAAIADQVKEALDRAVAEAIERGVDPFGALAMMRGELGREVLDFRSAMERTRAAESSPLADSERDPPGR